MTNHAERIYKLAVRAYPREYLVDHGDELIATACELHNDKVSVREALGLVTGGMRTRARVATTGVGAGTWASGLRLGLLFYYVSQFAWVLAPSSRVDIRNPIWLIVPITLMAGLTIGTGRWYAFPTTVIACASWARLFAETSANPPWWFALTSIAPLATAWWLALNTDGRRACSPLAGIVLSVAWWVTVTVAPGYLFGGLIDRVSPGLAMLAVALIGLVIINLDPRLFAGATIFFAINALASVVINVQLGGLVRVVAELAFAAALLTAAWFAVRRGTRQLHRV